MVSIGDRDVGAALAGLIATIASLIWRPIAWLWRQVTGTLGNWWELLTDREFAEARARDWFAFTIMAPIRYYGRLAAWSVAGDPREQIYGSIVLAISLIVVSFGVLTYVAVAVFLPLFVIGLIRMIPAANSAYDRTVTSALRSRSWVRKRE
jgi:hypothetical protein